MADGDERADGRESSRLSSVESAGREHGFQAQSAGFSAATMAALACPRSISFGLLLIGYVEGIDSECGESLERLLPDDLFGPLSSAAPTPHALRHRRRTHSHSRTLRRLAERRVNLSARC